jgi:tight adherence protein C
MLTALAAGATTGLGVSVIGYGLRPPRAPLVQVLDGLRRPVPARPAGRVRAYQLVAAPARGLGLPRPRVALDLATVQKDPTQHLAEQTLAVLVGVLVIPLAGAAAGLSGQVPLGLALFGAAVGFRWVDMQLHQHAQRRRDQMRHTLAMLLTLLTISLARGAGVEQALAESSSICTGPAADRLRQVLSAARVLRRPPWQDLGELGEATGVVELSELAAAVGLAGTQGARIRASLGARAAAMRQAATARAETEAEKASARMSVPLLLIGVGYLIFLLYPPIAAIGNTL